MYPLHQAIFQNDVQQIEQFCSAAEQSNAKDHHGNTPLHIACMMEHKGRGALLLFNLSNNALFSVSDDASQFSIWPPDKQTPISARTKRSCFLEIPPDQKTDFSNALLFGFRMTDLRFTLTSEPTKASAFLK
ncbi:hypothetical protein niasHS_003317 [Heterodera schachtii]|uniref:Uncharacterized protein n=2 Tax=Heterodera TaxID=34509 RepID=A0ABD2KGB3_HETSC